MSPERFNAEEHSIIYSFSVLSAALKAFLSLQHLIEIIFFPSKQYVKQKFFSDILK